MITLYFHRNPQAAFDLMQKQLADGWQWSDVEFYFPSLGYEREWFSFMASAVRTDLYLTKIIEG
jgi:hypothetical protein